MRLLVHTRDLCRRVGVRARSARHERGDQQRKRRKLRHLALAAVALATTTCSDPFDICRPVEGGRVGFFSRGDCVLTRASFFAGHEWVTHFANRRVMDDALFAVDSQAAGGFCDTFDATLTPIFAGAEIDAIIDGNRRVDYPKELLVHLNHGVLAYVEKLEAYHNEVDNQRLHFLLTDRNTGVEAAADSQASLLDRTQQAVRLWVTNRPRALRLLGSACHTLQDSFSSAHARRSFGADGALGCVAKVKAYMPRAAGFLTPDIEFHGGDEEDTIGHTTTQDSIYKAGRDCHDPTSARAVCDCLAPDALQAVRATRDYLLMVGNLVTTSADEVAVATAVEGFVGTHMSLCTQ